MFVVWPTPTGLGAALMYAKVVICHAGVCACAGMAVIPIEVTKSATIRITDSLLFDICIFITFSLRVWLRKNE
jgi:hypothetical protein